MYSDTFTDPRECHSNRRPLYNILAIDRIQREDAGLTDPEIQECSQLYFQSLISAAAEPRRNN